MATYFRIDGEQEVYNMDFVRKMWKANDATGEAGEDLPALYIELDTDQKVHIKFETASQRDAAFEELLSKGSVINIRTQSSPQHFVEL